MTHAERQALIKAPFTCERPSGCCERVSDWCRVTPGRTWSGGGMAPTVRQVAFDESYIRYSAGDE